MTPLGFFGGRTLRDGTGRDCHWDNGPGFHHVEAETDRFEVLAEGFLFEESEVDG